MAHLLITRWDQGGHGIKHLSFATEAEATAKRAALLDRFPSAFVCEQPAGFHFRTWKVNATGTGVEQDQAILDADTAEATYQANTAYIRKRKDGYRNEIMALKNYKGDYIDGMGFVLDAVIGEIVAIRAGQAQTAEFTALLQKIAAVKAANPKP